LRNPTSLNFNTSKSNGSEGNDAVDIPAPDSAHQILFRTNGGNATIVGTLRPQDVIELPAGLNGHDGGQRRVVAYRERQDHHLWCAERDADDCRKVEHRC
jgi:hypothetical protein